MNTKASYSDMIKPSDILGGHGPDSLKEGKYTYVMSVLHTPVTEVEHLKLEVPSS